MSLDVDVAAAAVRVPVSRARVVRLVRAALRAEGVAHALVSVAFVSPRQMATLNRRHLGHAGATDVLSFGLHRAPSGTRDLAIGDIYIAPAVAARNARERRLPARQEIDRLVVHGVLHVLGHDHPDDETRERSPMWKRQEAILRRFAGAAR